MKIEIPYYEDNTRISNSAIGWFLKKGPRYLKDMLDGKEEGISGKYLDKGTMIHMYLLQPDEFWHNYIVIDYEKPKNHFFPIPVTDQYDLDGMCRFRAKLKSKVFRSDHHICGYCYSICN